MTTTIFSDNVTSFFPFYLIAHSLFLSFLGEPIQVFSLKMHRIIIILRFFLFSISSLNHIFHSFHSHPVLVSLISSSSISLSYSPKILFQDIKILYFISEYFLLKQEQMVDNLISYKWLLNLNKSMNLDYFLIYFTEETRK